MAEAHASLRFDPSFAVGDVNPHLFGSFVEHLGRCVYTGLYEPGHPTADEDGLRTDVLALIRELGVTLVRYPGGNFVSGYRWEDGVGPVSERPRRTDMAWHSIETNEFGLGEFARFVAKVGAEPMMAVNLGTRGVQEACDLLEYSNLTGGTALSELRRAHGAKDPYQIKLWCLGNEMDGPWQIGYKTAEEYGRLAAQTARAMRLLDPSVRLVACGSSGSGIPTFAEWERVVLKHAYDSVDYISCHAYYEEHDGDVGTFLASAVDMERYIQAVVATCDHVGAVVRSQKRIDISFDEWNVWYMNRPANPWPSDWVVAPRLLEDVYTVTDAVVVGSLLITLLQHCDRVTAACLAQLVNVIGPIMTEPGGPAWRQTTFYPFAQASRFGRGSVLRTLVDGPTYETSKFGDVPVVHATAVSNEDGGVTVFAVNRDTENPVRLSLDGPMRTVVSHSVLRDDDRHAVNTLDNPDRVKPSAGDGVTLPPLSWNTIRLTA
ncbi:alpha-N-arabinofuranosidase [Allorhizocola rhizosphaerae]|uniref:arabinosylfuranosidase ArfA n=1 Tax=Allorhizocola rhizosphaerae TaxID=1872709 RepID=UPI000E3C126F|nr:alpha-N-arabinofuranosidase [Allorhizocola rhizosphaerae]